MRLHASLSPFLVTFSTLARGPTAQVQSLAEVDAICIVSNEFCAKVIQPLQCSFPEGINKQNVFDVEYGVCPGAKALCYQQEFMNPLPAKAPLENEHRRIFATWNRYSQHAPLIANGLPSQSGALSRPPSATYPLQQNRLAPRPVRYCGKLPRSRQVHSGGGTPGRYHTRDDTSVRWQENVFVRSLASNEVLISLDSEFHHPPI